MTWGSHGMYASAASLVADPVVAGNLLAGCDEML